jgi:predicted nucleic acid-binding protein
MVVVADTSPINYLVLIGRIELLAELYGQVTIPPALIAELRHPLAPRATREWTGKLPAWVAVLSPAHRLDLVQLDVGENEAIALASEIGADVLLIDERAGREEAVRRGLRVAGTLAVLDAADQAGLVRFDDAVAELRGTSFRVSPLVLSEIRRKRSS